MRTKKRGRFSIKSAIRNWLDIPLAWSDSLVSESGQLVNIDKALQLSTFWACIRLISESVSTLPLKLYRRNSDGSRSVATDHPLYSVLCRRPNAEMTPSRFMLMTVASIQLWGNAYIELKFIGNKIVAMVPLLPQNVSIKRLTNGRLEYTYTDYTEGKRTERKLTDDKIMHIRGFGIDGVNGLSPVSTGKQVLGSAMALEQSAAKMFENGFQSSGFISTPEALSDSQRESLREHLGKFSGSKNAGKVMILECGMNFYGISMNPDTAQMLESRGYSVEEICRWMNVPPFMIGHSDKQSSWASSIEGMNLIFLTNTLRPLLVNIEQEIQRCLLPHDEQYFAEFNIEGLLRADSAGRSAYYREAVQNGWMSRNEIRRLENMQPIPGGDLYTVQLNLTPLDLLGSEDTPEVNARNALKNWLSQDTN